MIEPKSVNIETPSGIALKLVLNEDGSVYMSDKAGYLAAFNANLIPEVRAILLDFERVYGESL